MHDFAYSLDGVSPEGAAAAGLTDMRSGEPLSLKDQQIGEAVASELSTQLVKGLRELGFDAVRTVEQPNLAGASSIAEIEGQFLKVDKGSTFLRLAIGLGVGKSIVDTQVQVYDANRSGKILVQKFTTHSRSSLKPGAAEAAALGPVAVGVNVGTGLAIQLTETTVADARRTANLIVSHMAALAYHRGWVSKEAALRAHAKLDDA